MSVEAGKFNNLGRIDKRQKVEVVERLTAGGTGTEKLLVFAHKTWSDETVGWQRARAPSTRLV